MSKILKLLITFLSIVIIQPGYANPHTPESDNFKIEHKGGGWYLQEAGILPLYHEGVNLYPDFSVGIYDSGLTPNHEDLHKRIKNVNQIWLGFDKQGKLISVNTPPSKVIEVSTHGNMVTGIFSGGIIGNSIGTRGIINAETNFIGRFAPVSSSFINNTFNVVSESSDFTVKGLEMLLDFSRKPKIISISMTLSPNTSMHRLKDTPEKFKQGLHYKETRVIREFIEKNSDVLFIVMAGNTGRDARMSNGAIHYDLNPQTFPILPPKNSPAWESENNYTYQPLNNLIIVGAYLNDNALASYSAFGESVDIVAPTDVMSIACSNGSDKHRYIIGESYGDNKQSYSELGNLIWNRIIDTATSNTCKTPNHLADGASVATPITAGVTGLLESVNSNLPPESIKGVIVNNAGGVVSTRHTSGATELISTGSLPKVNANSAYKTLMQNMGYSDSISRITYNFEQYLKSYNSKYLAGSSGTGNVTLGDERVVKSTSSGYPECLASNTSAECGNGTIDTLGECISVWRSFIGLTPIESGYQTSLFSDNICHYKEKETGKTIVYNSENGSIEKITDITIEELKVLVESKKDLFSGTSSCTDILNSLKSKHTNLNTVSVANNYYKCFFAIAENYDEFVGLEKNNITVIKEEGRNLDDGKVAFALGVLNKEYTEINSSDKCSSAANRISNIIQVKPIKYFEGSNSCVIGYHYNNESSCSFGNPRSYSKSWSWGCML